MKRTTLFFIQIIVLLMFTQCSPTTEEALEYNDKLIAEESEVINLMTALEEAIVKNDLVQIELTINAAKKQLRLSTTVLEKMGGFDNNTNFYDATIDLYKLFDAQLNNEYAEQFELCKLGDQRDAYRLNELQTQIDKRYNIIFNNFLDAQLDFSKEWNFEMK